VTEVVCIGVCLEWRRLADSRVPPGIAAAAMVAAAIRAEKRIAAASVQGAGPGSVRVTARTARTGGDRRGLRG